MAVGYTHRHCHTVEHKLSDIHPLMKQMQLRSEYANDFVFTVDNLGSIVWYIEAAGLKTPRFRFAMEGAMIGCPIAAAGGLIAAKE